VSLTECSSVASVSAAGGNGVYTASSGSNAVYARVVGSNTIIIGRQPSSIPPPIVQVGVGSGNALETVTVNVSGNALGNCDGLALAVTPSTVTLASCDVVQVRVTGNNGPIQLFSDNSSVLVYQPQMASDPNLVGIRRLGATFAGPATVTVKDNFSTRTVTVNGTGAGNGPC
jgi:hypothetical protein